MGSRIGRIAGTACRPVSIPRSSWPVTTIAALAMTRPMSIEPESPMKIRAGKKLCGRKPMHAPTSAATTTVAMLDTSVGLASRDSR